MQIINKILWIVCLNFILINSIYFSIKLRFPQFKIISALRSLFKEKKTFNISPKDTLIMTLSSKIGVGALSGTALCIYYGGIGTIFWMFISTFILSIINYIENALAIIYKDKKTQKSGPPYYLLKGLHNKKLAILYTILVLICYIFLFSSIQTNTISTLINNITNISKLYISIAITLSSGIIILKGIKTISNICNKIFPIMMLIFISVGLFVFFKEINGIPNIMLQIIEEAFCPKSLNGGIIYTIILTFQKSIFASESGVGTSAIISGSTDSNDHQLQAKIGLITNYFINFIVLGLTSLIIVTAKTGQLDLINGIELTKVSFFYHLGSFGELLLFILLGLFSFSTIITVYYYGESSLEIITKKKKYLLLLKLVAFISIFLGGIIKANVIWKSIDTFLAILTIINMYALFKLRKKVILKLKEK